MIRWVCIILGALCFAGCTTPIGGPSPSDPLPDAKQVLEAQHQAVDGLDRLFARCTVRVEGKDAEGNKLREQGEGVIQVIPSHRLAISLGKLGKTRLYLGSNEELYWWFDLLDDANRVSVHGRHELVTTEKTRTMGLPVHPLDLIELLAITPLPSEIEVVGRDDRGRVIVTHQASREGWGTRVVTYEQPEWKPVRVELLDENGEPVVTADLLGHARVSIEGDATRSPWVASRVEIRAVGFDGMVRIELFDPQNKTIRDVAFDFERLATRVFKINRFHDLDHEPGDGAEP